MEIRTDVDWIIPLKSIRKLKWFEVRESLVLYIYIYK